MMSTAHSHRARRTEPLRRLLATALVLFACALAVPAAQAATGECNKPGTIDADHGTAHAVANGVAHLWGHVVIHQCTRVYKGATATIHYDANRDAKRIVLTGNPAHLQQRDAEGKLVKLDGNLIVWDVPAATATLTGDVHIHEPGHGAMSADKVIYNVNASTWKASSKGDHRVHMTFQPSHPATAGSVHPAPASTSGGN